MWGTCKNGTDGSGCGRSETFRNCADISITTNAPAIQPKLVLLENPSEQEAHQHKNDNLPSNGHQIEVVQPTLTIGPLNTLLQQESHQHKDDNFPSNDHQIEAAQLKLTIGLLNTLLQQKSHQHKNYNLPSNVHHKDYNSPNNDQRRDYNSPYNRLLNFR